MDGTLLRSDGRLSTFTINALETLRERDVHIVALTARPRRLFMQIDGLADIVDWAVCDNGASTWAAVGMSPVSLAQWPLDVVDVLVAELRRRIPGCSLAFETGDRTLAEAAFVARAGELAVSPDDVVERLDGRLSTISKIMVIADHGPNDLCEVLARLALHDCRPTHSGSPYVEICPPAISKMSALAALCEELKVEREGVVAFGDMPNDLQLLEWAGTGVAVANAHPDVLAIADVVAAPNDSDGVAHYLMSVLTDTSS